MTVPCFISRPSELAAGSRTYLAPLEGIYPKKNMGKYCLLLNDRFSNVMPHSYS